MAVTNEPSDIDIWKLSLRFRMNITYQFCIKHYLYVNNTNMTMTKKIVIMSDKINKGEICIYGNITSI
jgi:hypothetical protein